MSHSKERSQKSCLNCKALVAGRYCSICGQENLVPQESLTDIILHFFNDLTHFDGKFFITIKDLIFRPGFLAKEYVAGRRASYLNPVRLYLFTSFIFFLVLFTIFSKETVLKVNRSGYTPADSIANVASRVRDTTRKFKLVPNENVGKVVAFQADLLESTGYNSREEYDSLWHAGKVKDGFLERAFMRKRIALKNNYGNDYAALAHDLFDSLKHRAPQVFFLSLPLFAFWLKLLYIRRKKFYYVAHIVFTLHLYVFVYITAFFMYLLAALSDLRYMDKLSWLIPIILVADFYYAYRAMRNFYAQGRFKTVLKFTLLMLWLITILSTLTVFMFAFSLYKL